MSSRFLLTDCKSGVTVCCFCYLGPLWMNRYLLKDLLSQFQKRFLAKFVLQTIKDFKIGIISAFSSQELPSFDSLNIYFQKFDILPCWFGEWNSRHFFFSWANKFEPMRSSWCHVESIFAYRRILHPNWRRTRGFIRIQFDSDHSGEICTRTMMVHWAWVLSIRDFVVIKIAVTRVPYSIACACKGENHNLKPDIYQKLLLFSLEGNWKSYVNGFAVNQETKKKLWSYQ